APGDTGLEFVARRAEPGPPHQVRHQCDVVLVCHLRGLLLSVIRHDLPWPSAEPMSSGAARSATSSAATGLVSRCSVDAIRPSIFLKRAAAEYGRADSLR